MTSRWKRHYSFTILVASGILSIDAVGASAGSPPGELPKPARQLILIVYDQARIATGTMRQAQEDVLKIFASAGVELAWIDSQNTSRFYHAIDACEEPFRVHVVVRRRLSASNESRHVMGTSFGANLPSGASVHVFYDEALRLALRHRRPPGKILGMVIAHELGHILLPMSAHSPNGIMRADWDGDGLMRTGYPNAAFADDQADVIRHKLALNCPPYAVDDSSRAKRAIADALALLPDDVRPQIGDIVVVTSPDERWLRHSNPVLQAQVFEGDETIYVAHWGDAFRHATAGKPAWLASAIVHELTHLRNGPDERSAYDAQLATLRQLNAPARMIRSIERAKAAVVHTRN